MMPLPSYQEKDYVLIHHDRSNYCHDGNCVLVGNGQMFPVKEIHDNTITVEDGGGFQFQLELPEHPNVQLFNTYVLPRWDKVKDALKNDENYTDYIPAYYTTLEAFRNGTMVMAE